MCIFSKGVEVIHLTTHNQQGFYQKLGYEFCDPIVVFGQCPQHLQKVIFPWTIFLRCSCNCNKQHLFEISGYGKYFKKRK